MPRESRKRSNSGVYHIMLRGINRQHIFEDDEDYSRFLETLAKYREECGYSLYGYCLMPNHVHLVLREGKQPFYDVWVTGNHEYDYGLDAVKKIIRDLRCRVLTGNVYDADGNPIADGYAILSVNGIRVAVIGMVTPNIARWSAPNLAGCAVTDPLEAMSST